MKTRIISASLALALAFGAAPMLATAASHSEAVDGDISGDRFAPTSLSLDVGSNTISGTTIAGDLDYITLVVPTGYVFSQLVLTGGGGDNLAFIAIDDAAFFEQPNVGADPAALFGWSHLAFPEGIGLDHLELMGSTTGAYTGPLPAGPYTLWIQQTGPELTQYTFDAIVTPEPAAFGLLALGLAGLGIARRRRA